MSTTLATRDTDAVITGGVSPLPADLKSITQLAHRIGTSPSTVARWLKRGARGKPPIPHFRSGTGSGSLVRASESVLLAWLSMSPELAPTDAPAPTPRSRRERIRAAEAVVFGDGDSSN